MLALRCWNPLKHARSVSVHLRDWQQHGQQKRTLAVKRGGLDPKLLDHGSDFEVGRGRNKTTGFVVYINLNYDATYFCSWTKIIGKRIAV